MHFNLPNQQDIILSFALKFNLSLHHIICTTLVLKVCVFSSLSFSTPFYMFCFWLSWIRSVSGVSYVLFGLLKRSWCFLFEAFDISIAQLFRITFYKPGGQFSWVNSLKRAPFLYHFFQIFGWLGRAIRWRRWNYFLLMFHPKITISNAHALNLNWRNYFP